MLENKNLDEMLCETYLNALEQTCFQEYKMRLVPPQPVGYFEDYQDYRVLKKPGDKAEAWKALFEKYSGYFKAVEAIELQNKSDMKFIEEMHDFFKSKSMYQQAEICRLKLLEFIN